MLCTSILWTDNTHTFTLTSFPSSSKASNCMEMRYWVGATTCQTQFLLGGYSLGQPGVLMVPFNLERRPPHAAGNTHTIQKHTRAKDMIYMFTCLTSHKGRTAQKMTEFWSCFILHCGGSGIPLTLPNRIIHSQPMVDLVNVSVSCFYLGFKCTVL